MLSADLEGAAADQLGVRPSVVEAIALKTLFYLGEASVQELADRMHIGPYVVEGIFQRMRKDMLMQALGLTDGGHRVNLTSAGRTRAAELLSIDQYVGPVPVSLADYIERLKSQTVRDIVVHPPDVAEAFRDLVLDNAMLAQVGTAVTSGRAIFLYGPPGSGKTTIAEKMSELFRKEAVWIPYAVEIDGQMITVFDDHVHERVEGRRRAPRRHPLGAAGARASWSAASSRSTCSTSSSTRSRRSTRRRSRCGRTTAFSSSTTSAASASRRPTCSTAGSCRSIGASTI
jgi:predicted ATPase with chaperone activity